MKNQTKQVITIAVIILIAMSLISCGSDSKTKPKLTGTVNINGIMEVGEEVTISITDSNGTAEKFTYQWTRTPDGGIALDITDAKGQHYIITEADIGHTLGAIVSNEDTTGTISGTSAEKVAEPFIEPGCECEDKEHLGIGEDCCDKDDCECTYKVYSTLANGVKVYRKGTFEEGKVEDIAGRAVTTYANLDPDRKETFTANITEIHIVEGNHNQTVRRGTIMELGVDIAQTRLQSRFEGVLEIPQVEVAKIKAIKPFEFAKALGSKKSKVAKKFDNFKKNLHVSVANDALPPS